MMTMREHAPHIWFTVAYGHKKVPRHVCLNIGRILTPFERRQILGSRLYRNASHRGKLAIKQAMENAAS